MPEDMVVGFDVTCRGQYYASSGKDRLLKVFGPVTFFLPEYVEIPNGKKKTEKMIDGVKRTVHEPQTKRSSVAVDNVALWVIQRRLLPTWLAENHPDQVGFRTCQVTPGGMKRVQRPASQVINLDKKVTEMSMQELAAFCRMKNLNVPVSAFKDVVEARAAVIAEMDPASGAAEAAAALPPVREAEVPTGVVAKSGAVSSEDGIATDEEDPAADLI